MKRPATRKAKLGKALNKADRELIAAATGCSAAEPPEPNVVFRAPLRHGRSFDDALNSRSVDEGASYHDLWG